MTERLVVIGGSAGALPPLEALFAELPADLPAAVLVVVHVLPDMPSVLPRVLGRAGKLPVRHAEHGDEIRPGEALVAVPDRHLVVHGGVVHLSRGPRENRHRPAVDALFNSAARWWGPRVVGVVLSGVLDDGAAGAAAIAAQDGVVLVQDPRDAQCSGMPEAVLRTVRRARTAPAERLGMALQDLVRTVPAEEEKPADEVGKWESANVDSQSVEDRGAPPPGMPAALGCPECQGGMFEMHRSGGDIHYACHVGHSWSPETLLAAQREASEGALYNAASKLLEEAAVLRRLAEHAEHSEDPEESARAKRERRRANRAEERAAEIQKMVRSED